MSSVKKKIHIVDICQNHSFFSFLQLTKKYHEFVAGESLASCGISIFFSMLFYLTLSIDIMNDMLKSLFSLLVPAYIGIIGFLFSGLALMSAIITKKALKVIDKEGHIRSVVGILFSFYYCGGIILVSLAITGSFYLYSYYQNIVFPYTLCGIYLYWFIVWITLYFTIYSLIYTVSLLGSCIKFFFVNVWYDKMDDNNSEYNENGHEL